MDVRLDFPSMPRRYLCPHVTLVTFDPMTSFYENLK